MPGGPGFALAAYLLSGVVIVWSEGAIVSQLAVSGLATGPIVVDYLGFVFRWLALFVGAMFTVLTLRDAERETASERLGTLMLFVVGLMLVARANDLVFLFVSLELISIPTYVLLYLGRRDRATSEATLKYFYLSILSSALLLYGMSFLYGITGTTALRELPDLAQASHLAAASALDRLGIETGTLIYLALVLIAAGLGFKMAAVPFHFYAPDVYQGATNANAGLLAIAPKIAGVLAFVRLLVLSFPEAATSAWQLSLILAIMTMTLGNVCALWQQNVRRLLAYSSIAHAGYLLIGLSVALAASESTLGQRGGRGGRAVVPVCLRPGVPGVLRGPGLSEQRGARSRRRGGTVRLGTYPTADRGGPGDLPVLPGRYPAPGRLLGQAGPVLRRNPNGHRSTDGAHRAVVYRVGGGRSPECGDRRGLLSPHHCRDLLPPPRQTAVGRRRVGAWLVTMSSAALLVIVGLFPRTAFEAARSSEQSSRAQLSASGEPSRDAARR